MLLQAACLARLGNALNQERKHPFIVSEIYIDDQLRARWYFVYQPDYYCKVDLAGCCSLLISWQVGCVKESFDLKKAERAFYFVFWLYNFVSLAIEDSNPPNPLLNVAKLSSDIQGLDLPSLTGKRKTRDDDDAGNGSPKKPKYQGGFVESDITSDRAILAALKRTGYTIPDKDEGFELLLPVRVTFPRKRQRLTLPLS